MFTRGASWGRGLACAATPRCVACMHRPAARPPCSNGLGKSSLLNFLMSIHLSVTGYALPADNRPDPSTAAVPRPKCRLAAELERAKQSPRLVYNPQPTANADHLQRAGEALEEYWFTGNADLADDSLLLPVGSRMGTTTQVSAGHPDCHGAAAGGTGAFPRCLLPTVTNRSAGVAWRRCRCASHMTRLQRVRCCRAAYRIWRT